MKIISNDLLIHKVMKIISTEYINTHEVNKNYF